MTKRTIFNYLAHHLAERPDQPVYLFEGRSFTFRDIHTLGGRCRAVLRGVGLQPGDRVALLMHDGPEMITALLATMGAGAIAVPCCTSLTRSELSYIMRDCGARYLIATSEHREVIESLRGDAALPETVLIAGTRDSGPFTSFDQAVQAAPVVVSTELESDAPAFIIYTSGSTGSPKGAVHRHADITHTIERARALYEIGPHCRLFSAPRLYFGYGFTNSFSFPLGLGASCILAAPRPTSASIATVFARYKPNVFFGVPTHFRSLLEYHEQGNMLDTTALAFSLSAGEKLSAQLFQRWNVLTGTPIIDFMGTTELLYAFISNRKDRIRPGSCGTTVDGYEIKLIDDRECVVEGEGTGALYVRGPSAITHYWNKPEKTKETIRDGWVCTGDIFRRDCDGYYFFEGRSGDVFKSSGLWVSPAEVEEVLCAHAAVLDAAIVSEPGPQGDFAIQGFIVLKPGVDRDAKMAESILAQASRVLPRHKRPKTLRFLQQLPRTPTGKLQRFRLRALAAMPDAAMSIAV